MALTNKRREQALSPERLRSCLRYDAETGVFHRLFTDSPNPRASQNAIAGSLTRTGYRLIRIGHDRFLAHRLAWFYVHGEWPPDEIDHINRRKDDNRLCNLRLSSRKQNTWNLPPSRRSKTGLINISMKAGKLAVEITRNGSRVLRQRCDTIEAAVALRDSFLRAPYQEVISG